MYMKIFFILIFLQGFISQDFEETMEKLETLENYVSQFIEEKKNSKTLIELFTTYMRKVVLYIMIFFGISYYHLKVMMIWMNIYNKKKKMKVKR